MVFELQKSYSYVACSRGHSTPMAMAVGPLAKAVVAIPVAPPGFIVENIFGNCTPICRLTYDWSRCRPAILRDRHSKEPRHFQPFPAVTTYG